MSAEKILEEMAKTYRERNAVYGNNFKKMGPVMTALFPEGITLKTEQDFINFHLFDWMVGKITRFASTGMTHLDSIHDSCVYGAMLENEIIESKKGETK